MNTFNFINQDGLIYLGQVLFKYEGTKKDVVIPEGITRIHHEAFLGTEISSVTFPKSLHTIGSNVFANCRNLRELFFPENVKKKAAMCFADVSWRELYFHENLMNLGTTVK